MTRIVAALLLLWEPLHFAREALTFAPTLADRGWAAGFELGAHGVAAALASAAGLSLWNETHDCRRLATVAITVSVARVAQSLHWTVLPANTMPGDQPLILGTAVLIAIVAIAIVHRPHAALRTKH